MRLDKAVYTVFDFETTGLYPYSGDRICEIGALKGPSKGRPRRFHSLVNPMRSISHGAFAVNGITDKMVRSAPAIDDILPQFMDFIKGSVLVAYNAGFDLGFLEHALGEGKGMLADYVIIDVLGLARRLFTGIGRYNLGNVAQSLGISSEGEHRAMSDTVMTWKVFKKELELLEAEGIETVEAVAYAGTKVRTPVKKVRDYRVKLIEEAIREQKKLNIVYRSNWSNSVTRRTIAPKEVKEGFDRLYVIAHCHLRNDERNFRIDGIMDIEVVE